jgi:hypothetical protein
VLVRQYHRDNNEFVEMSVLRYKEQEVYAFVETLMPHAMQIRQTGGPEVLNWTAVDVGEPESGQVRLRQAPAGLNFIDVYHRTEYYSQPLNRPRRGNQCERCGVLLWAIRSAIEVIDTP